MTRRSGIAALVVLIVVAAGAPARAQEVTAERFRELARAAATDPEARAAFAKIDSVEGVPVDTAALLDGSEAELRDRLRVIADDSGRSGVDAAQARLRARDILQEDRFHGDRVPRPVRGLLQRVGDGLRRAVAPIGRAFVWLEEHFPGGPLVFRIVIGSLVLALLVFVVALIARRRARAIHAAAPARSPRVDPAELEREADEAERAGDFERSVRLRFQAGLLRLEEVHAVVLSPYRTSGELGRRLLSPSFSVVASAFDEIVYGGRPAGASDAALARDGMRRVLNEVATR